jgi:hypothetical protein
LEKSHQKQFGVAIGVNQIIFFDKNIVDNDEYARVSYGEIVATSKISTCGVNLAALNGIKWRTIHVVFAR